MCTVTSRGLQGVQRLCTGNGREYTGGDREEQGIFIRTEAGSRDSSVNTC